MTSTPTITTNQDGSAARTALAVLLAAAASAIAVAVIAAIAHAAGVRHDFKPLTPGSFLPLTVLGVLAGGVGWHSVRRRAAQPATVLRRLVPAVVILSLVPDIALGIGGGQPGTTWVGVAALICMHIAVATTAVLIFRRAMPLR
jgi:hypothetical protein